MNSHERRRKAAEFANINRLQDQGQEKRRKDKKIDLSHLKTFEYLVQDPETPWVENFIDLVKAGKRQESYQADRFNQAVEGMVIPAGVAGQLQRVLGRDNLRFTDRDSGRRKKEPFSLDTITDQLLCTPEQAATLLAFTILLEDKYSIVTALKHPELQAQFGVNFDQEKVKAFFKSEEFLNAATNKTLERSLPLLAKEAGIKGVQHIIRYLRVFQFNPNQEHLRRVFGTQNRREQFKTLLTADLKEGLDMLRDYEYLFGELTREEFLELFPNWQEAEGFRTYTYERALGLKRPEPIPATPTTEPTIPPAARPPSTEPRQVVSPKPAEAPPLPPPAELKQLMRWGAVALGLASAGTAGVGAVAWEVSNRFATEAPSSDESEKQLFVAKPSLNQGRSIESNNFSPEATEFEHGDNFVAVPELHSMRATAVYTTIEPHGRLTYQPEYAFTIDPKELNDANSREHVVAERFFAQGAVLYPPELGAIDPSSITVPGHEADEFTVTTGEQGKFQVLLNEPSSKPLEVVYTVRVVHGSAHIDFTDELPPIPKIENSGGLERKIDESDLAFALRAEQALRSQYDYPQTAREKGLSFDEAQQARIGDCDVVNQELLAVLQNEGIPAVMVVDTHPVPGRENHGQVRAITYSQITYGYVVTELDATPHTYTTEGAVAAKAENKQVAGIEESEAQRELKKLIDEYTQAQESEPTAGTAKASPSVEATPTPEAGQRAATPRVIEDREWRALGGGVYGYAEYVLKHSFSLPEDPKTREKLIGELAEVMLKELQRTKVISEGKNPYEWARNIDREEAQALLKAMDSSPLIGNLVRYLPKYPRKGE